VRLQDLPDDEIQVMEDVRQSIISHRYAFQESDLRKLVLKGHDQRRMERAVQLLVAIDFMIKLPPIGVSDFRMHELTAKGKSPLSIRELIEMEKADERKAMELLRMEISRGADISEIASSLKEIKELKLRQERSEKDQERVNRRNRIFQVVVAVIGVFLVIAQIVVPILSTQDDKGLREELNKVWEKLGSLQKTDSRTLSETFSYDKDTILDSNVVPHQKATK
jgi:hypothetical protein